MVWERDYQALWYKATVMTYNRTTKEICTWHLW